MGCEVGRDTPENLFQMCKVYLGTFVYQQTRSVCINKKLHLRRWSLEESKRDVKVWSSYNTPALSLKVIVTFPTIVLMVPGPEARV